MNCSGYCKLRGTIVEHNALVGLGAGYAYAAYGLVISPAGAEDVDDRSIILDKSQHLDAVGAIGIVGRHAGVYLVFELVAEIVINKSKISTTALNVYIEGGIAGQYRSLLGAGGKIEAVSILKIGAALPVDQLSKRGNCK